MSPYRSAEDFRPEDGQTSKNPLARLKQAKRYAKAADDALQNIEVVSLMTRRVQQSFAHAARCSPLCKRDLSFLLVVLNHHDLSQGIQPRTQTLWSRVGSGNAGGLVR